jgi:hypothetical protein
MKLIVFLSLACLNFCFAQEKLSNTTPPTHYSKGVKMRAEQVHALVADAENYFTTLLGIKPEYSIWVLSPADWKVKADPLLIYGMPHFDDKSKIIVASEDNLFWKRNTPPVERLSKESGEKLLATYGNPPSLMSFFDLLSVHELGHVFQKEAGMVPQRKWLNELLCNILLHTYVAENKPELLPHLTTFTETNIEAFPKERLVFSALKDFDPNYVLLGSKHPDNYGWYQCQFHVKAGKIYDLGGEAAVKKLWQALVETKTVLNEQDLNELLYSVDPAFEKVLKSW